MRTTVDIPEHLLLEAKQLAAKQKRPLTVLITESLRAFLAAQHSREHVARSIRLPVNRKAKLASGVDLSDTSALWSVDDSL